MTVIGVGMIGKRYKTMTEREMEDILNDAFGITFWRYLSFKWSGLEEEY